MTIEQTGQLDPEHRHLCRERFYSEGATWHKVAGEYVRSTDSLDVYAPIAADSYPQCQDCGGALQWSENGYVPGTRLCAECGSMFSDSLYGAHVSELCQAE